MLFKGVAKHYTLRDYGTQTSELLEINRNTINRHYNIFRKLIYNYQTDKFETIIGNIESDESYFGASSLGNLEENQKR